MAMSPRKRGLRADQRRALRVLAGSPHGCTEAIMLAHGFTVETLGRLVLDGHATATHHVCRWAADHGDLADGHRHRAAGACRMMVAGPASCARTLSMRILRQRATQSTPKKRKFGYVEHHGVVVKIAP
jgi:hypothetical protein